MIFRGRRGGERTIANRPKKWTRSDHAVASVRVTWNEVFSFAHLSPLPPAAAVDAIIISTSSPCAPPPFQLHTLFACTCTYFTPDPYISTPIPISNPNLLSFATLLTQTVTSRS
jgi:hypothetical protein